MIELLQKPCSQAAPIRHLLFPPLSCNNPLFTIADVDGTLIHSVGQRANFLHKQAFTAAFAKVFDIDTNIDVVKHHGRCTFGLDEMHNGCTLAGRPRD